MEPIKCDCGHTSEPSKFTPGYGCYQNPETGEWETHCYDCCAKNERQWMIDKGRTALYLVQNDDKPWEVTDWPGRLRFVVMRHWKGRHNIAQVRYDVWFRGPDGHIWWGVQYGDFTQVVHCKRTKEAA